MFHPNTTQTPNVIIDVVMRDCAKHPARFFVLMAIVRKTYGWQKKEDKISLSQLIELTGLSKNGVKGALKWLIKMKYVKSVSKGSGRKISKYRLLINELPEGQPVTIEENERVNEKPPQGQPVTPRVATNDPCKGQPVTPQNIIKQTLTKENIQKKEEPLTPARKVLDSQETVFNYLVKIFPKMVINEWTSNLISKACDGDTSIIDLKVSLLPNHPYYKKWAVNPETLLKAWNELIEAPVKVASEYDGW